LEKAEVKTITYSRLREERGWIGSAKDRLPCLCQHIMVLRTHFVDGKAMPMLKPITTIGRNKKRSEDN
jgi:hypothetical protein